MHHSDYKNIPSSYNMVIERIPSMQMRDELRRTIDSIFKYAKALDGIEIEPDTLNAYNQFVRYIEKSSSSPAKFQVWSEWILTYGKVVHDRIANRYYSSIDHNHTDYHTALQEMVEKIPQLIQSVASYQTSQQAQDSIYKDMILEICEKITAGLTIPNHHRDFWKIKTIIAQMELIDNFITSVLTEDTVTGVDNGRYIYNCLWELHKKVTYPKPRRASLQ